MILRSLLFVPGDSEKKLAKTAEIDADALILDLEDAVAPSRRDIARGLIRDFLHSQVPARGARLWVRINSLHSADADKDLDAVVAARPYGIVLPKPESPEDTRELGRRLEVLERERGVEPGSIAILPVATEVPAALFRMGDYANCCTRLQGLTWGAEDLSTALGASANKEADGTWTFTYQLARSLCLAAAYAAGVQAIDTLYADFRDADGLDGVCRTARRDGFTGKLAIHPSQVEIINRAFTPDAEEIDQARRVIQAFSEHPEAGTVSLDGRMLDAPHLKQAQRILELARIGETECQ